MEQKRVLSTQLFDQEIVTPADLARVDQYKSIQDQIDELLATYKDWEQGGQGKKEE